MKVASFNVRADARQSARWKMEAERAGYASVGAWAAVALDDFIELRRKMGHPQPLVWSLGRFRVRFEDGSEPEVRGWISRPFGVFHGSPAGPIPHGSTHTYSLVFLPDRRLLATFRRAGHCRSLAADLLPVLIRGDPLPPAAGIIERHRREAV